MNPNGIHSAEGIPILKAKTKKEFILIQRSQSNPYGMIPRNLSFLEELLKCAV